MAEAPHTPADDDVDHGRIEPLELIRIFGEELRALAAIPQNAQILECPRMTVTAGFCNSHVHFFERKWANVADTPPDEVARQLRDMLTRYGFTSVFDTGSMWDNTRCLRDRINSGEVPGPRLRSTGEGLVPPGSQERAY